MHEREVILSIETAVKGGSLSILANGTEIDGWSGTLEISKAEDVLEHIAKLLNDNNIARSQIRIIGISKGIGSSTGQKIGSALAKGLRKSLKCGLVETSVLEALLLEIKENFEGECVTAVASGKNHIWWQVFTLKKNFFCHTLGPQVSGKKEFYEIINQIDFKKIVFSSELLSNNSDALPTSLNKRQNKLIISNQSLAKLAGLGITRLRI